MRRAIILAVAVLALRAAGALGAPPAVALVVDVIGEATVGGAPAEPVKLMAAMPAGSQLRIADAAQVVVFYVAEGTEYTLKGPGGYRLLAKAPAALGAAAAPSKKLPPQAMRTMKLRTDGVVQAGLTLRDGGPSLRAPVSDVVLDSSAVSFAWDSFGEGVLYQFELVDEAGQPVLTAKTADLQLLLPERLSLLPGRTYLWAIRGRGGSSAQPFYRAAQFRVIDAQTRQRLAAAAPAADSPFSERVLYTAMLESVGARGAALAYRRTLAAERPAAWAR